MNFERVILENFPDLAVERNFSFARRTTIGCGGTAPCCLYPKTSEQAAALICFLKSEKIPFYLLGAGANVLPPDGEFGGVIVKFSFLNEIFAEGELLFAGAGVTGGRLLRFARERGLKGLEPFSGIPMTVGGGCAMNAGVADAHFSDVVERVKAIEEGEILDFSNAQCDFSKKSSVFSKGIFVTEVCFRLQKADPRKIAEREALYRERRKTLPKGRSMGCVFVNPEVMPAGMLIERCGLKGLRVGGAYVSEAHANFIINEGGTSKDVSSLIAIVKEEVKRGTGITLREEIRRIL